MVQWRLGLDVLCPKRKDHCSGRGFQLWVATGYTAAVTAVSLSCRRWHLPSVGKTSVAVTVVRGPSSDYVSVSFEFPEGCGEGRGPVSLKVDVAAWPEDFEGLLEVLFAGPGGLIGKAGPPTLGGESPWVKIVAFTAPIHLSQLHCP